MEKLKSSPEAGAPLPFDEPFAAAGSRPAPSAAQAALDPTDTFVRRHIGSSDAEIAAMLARLGLSSLAELVAETVPASIRLRAPLALSALPDRPLGERETLEALRRLAERNLVFRSFLGMGYHDCIVPGVIQRNILENPGCTRSTPPTSRRSRRGASRRCSTSRR